MQNVPLLVVFWLAGSALATEPHSTSPSGPIPAGFKLLDTDSDGMVSTTEAGVNPKLLNRYTELDTNHDGLLNATEFAAFQAIETPLLESPP